MKYFLILCLIFLHAHGWAQSASGKTSPLFFFDHHARPRVFTDSLGHHPQFPFLQKEKGIGSASAFIRSSKDSASRRSYGAEFRVFNALLKEIGFHGGYKDLKAAHVKNTFVPAGTIGNLGYYNKDKDGNGYIYVQLDPAGESLHGVAAWKIAGPSGYLYILHTCGNAFYPNKGGGECCREIRAETRIHPLEIKPSVVDRPLHIRIDLYTATILGGSGHRRKDGSRGSDTLVKLLRSIDTIAHFRDSAGRSWKVYTKDVVSNLLVCRDSVIQLRPVLIADSTGGGADSVLYLLADTTFVTMRSSGGSSPCQKKWEISVDGGISYNSIPRFDNTATHSRTDGSHVTAELAVSRIFSHWLQAGLSASYITLSYQDDVAYPGSVAGTYNTVYAGKPIIPVQLFAKATIGGPLRWQSNVSLSAGYSIPTGDRIVNSGNDLAIKPSTKGGFTAGLKLGLAYFFSCRFGAGISFNGQYFSNKASNMSYHLVALPITAGLRFRF